MEFSFFSSPTTLLAGLFSGIVFGFLLRKGHATRYETIVGQFLLRDFTVLKIMMSAVAVGSVGVYGFLQMGWITQLQLDVHSSFGAIAGAMLFGVGMATLGYCPGTGIAAMADGARDAIAGVVGMVAGAALYAEIAPMCAEHLLFCGCVTDQTLVDWSGASPWWFVSGFALFTIVFFTLIERWEQQKRVSLAPSS